MCSSDLFLVDHLARFFIDQEFQRLLDLDLARAGTAAAQILKHALQLLGHLFHTRRRHDFHAQGHGAHFNLDLAVVELPLAQHLAKALPRVVVFGSGLLGDRLAGKARLRPGQQDIQHPIFRRIRGAVPNFRHFLFSRHFDGDLDKIARRQETVGADVSREGVQRDLLPLVEGCTVNTKYGTVKTDHVLFIASGAFHMSKPSDLIPELQGRLPIRVELEPLVVGDFVRILTEPDASLTRQYSALMATEGLTLEFAESGVQRLAEVAFEVNERTENIGARRLHTVMERLLESVSFDAADRNGTRVVIDRDYVEGNLGELVKDQDLSRYIL